jgi:hypothetical protein
MGKVKIVKIKKNTLPSFSIEVGQIVIWENQDKLAHQLNSDTENQDFIFDVGILFPGEISSPVLFDTPSTTEGFVYGCGLVPGLKATIHVGTNHPGQPDHDHMPHDSGQGHGGGHHDHLKHFHGFVTGGKTGDKIYMTHTPIFSDERHHFQIILQASFVEEKHLTEYNKLRNSEYGAGKVQLFFDHLALIDIQSGVIKELEADSLRFYPNVPTVRPGLVMPLVSTIVPEFARAKIKIDKILHFRTFTPDMPYPETLTYLMYGNENDVFIDHFISRAPNFHSVAKLSIIPSFWTKQYHDTAIIVTIPVMKIRDASPKAIKRLAFLDDQFHLIWGLPSGALLPVDPLVKISSKGEFEMTTEKGEKGKALVSNFLHFDATRLLNDGLGF